MHETIVFDVTFVDDEAIVITAAVPETLANKFRCAVQLLIEAFDRYGMCINWKPGKTEAMIAYRGKRAKVEKDRLFLSGETCNFSIYPGATTDVRINVVPQYKHLGSIIAASRSLVPEARQRVRSAMNAFAPIATKSLGSKSISLQRRIALGWSLVVSRLFYSLHVWSTSAGRAQSIINSMYMRLWRRILNDPRYQRTKWSDREVRVALAVPSADCYARKRRLCNMSRLARTEFDALHAALQARGKCGEFMPWVSLIIQDIAVLRDNVQGKLDEVPPPQEGLQEYWRIAKEFPQEWKALVGMYFTVDEDKSHKPASDVKHPCADDQPTCDACGTTFESSKKLATHRWAKHKVKSDVRTFIGDTTTCTICGTNFFTRNRLVKHLLERRSRSKT